MKKLFPLVAILTLTSISWADCMTLNRLPAGTVVQTQQATYTIPVVQQQQQPVQYIPAASPACQTCQPTAASLPVTYQSAPQYDVSQLLAACQQLLAQQQVQTYSVPTATYSLAAPTYSLPSYSYSLAVRSLPSYYSSASFAPSYLPVRTFSRSLSGYTSSGDFAAQLPSRIVSPVFAPRIIGHSGQVAAFNPGGFRAGFSGAGLNGSGGSGFLTGGGLLGGAANFLGVSSSGLEGAALGILATRSNLFGLARKR